MNSHRKSRPSQGETSPKPPALTGPEVAHFSMSEVARFSMSLDMDALEMALEGGRKPEIFHSDQGCQFTSSDFVARLQTEKIKISWSGRKRCYDNILVERLWRRVKYEEVYLRAYSDGWEAEISLARFLWRYCHVRPHSSLGGKTPHEVYTETEPCSSRPELTMSGAGNVQ
jgi:putative transposase